MVERNGTKTQSLKTALTKQELNGMLEKYHFPPEELLTLCSIYDFLIPLVQAQLWYEVTEEKACIIVTLGKQVDELQDKFSGRERLSEAYMIEILAMELLQKACAMAEECIHEATGRWVDRPEYIGENRPIEEIREVLEKMRPETMSCTSMCMLNPRKSVVYYAGLTKERQERHGNACSSCTNRNCTYRAECDKTNCKENNNADCKEVNNASYKEDNNADYKEDNNADCKENNNIDRKMNNKTDCKVGNKADSMINNNEDIGKTAEGKKLNYGYRKIFGI